MRNHKTGIALLLILVLLCAELPLNANAAKTYTGTIVKDNIFFRSRPSTSSGWILRFKKDDEVQISGEDGDFYKVTFNGRTGYVMKKFVNLSTAAAAVFGKTAAPTEKADPKMAGITKISQIKVPATTKKGSSGQHVLALQQALKLKGFYKALINSKFDDTTVAAVKAYQKSAGLSQTGAADYATIKKLFGKDAADYKPTPTPTPKKTATPKPTATVKASKGGAEELVWFSKGKSVFPSGVTFQVKDVQTGKVWTCKRLYAGNHLDAEPLTASDTAVMKAVYGGNFNYVRRPVLVKINGHVYAGSMYGVPHGDFNIKDNNFDGQFCIHFTGSMTSSSKVVDSAHQAAIQKALKASW